uniref:Putative secreted protein n=1 Tax=Anopheles triannulatus TaxID=58253 RepID=A0A2M4B7C8_9DIPT
MMWLTRFAFCVYLASQCEQGNGWSLVCTVRCFCNKLLYGNFWEQWGHMKIFGCMVRICLLSRRLLMYVFSHPVH